MGWCSGLVLYGLVLYGLVLWIGALGVCVELNARIYQL
jgi:hypothetical protein